MVGPIIYVEDEPDDAFFMARALRSCVPDFQLKILTDGEEAMNFFEHDFMPMIEGHSPPGLVLLDLNLPGRSGLEILHKIRSLPHLRLVPVIILTSSNQSVDIAEAYRQGCSGYLVKPRSADRLAGLVNTLTEFWIKENQYPQDLTHITPATN